MPCAGMVTLRYRAVGQTPIYDQLRGERISADVSPRAGNIYRLADVGRHCLGEDASSAAAGVVRPARRGTAEGAGHPGRVRAYSAAGLTDEERGRVPTASLAQAGVRTAPRHARDECRADEQMPDFRGEQGQAHTPSTVPLNRT